MTGCKGIQNGNYYVKAYECEQISIRSEYIKEYDYL